MMGAGIAYVQALAGIETILIDQTQDAADKGKAHVEELLKKRLSRGQLTQEKYDALLGSVTATTDYDLIKGSDLVVEAVFENREIKADVTKRAEAQLAEGAVFGSNTSTLPITGLAEASVRPEDFIGIHFFSPVDKMMLVEIILGEKTASGRHRQGAGLCAEDQEDADRRQRLQRFLHLPLLLHLPDGGHGDAGGGLWPGPDRQCRTHDRHAARPAGDA